MDEQKLPVNPQVTQPSPPKAHGFPTGKKEICLWWVIVALCVLWVDFAFYGGFALGTALVTLGLIILLWVYLPKKRDPYATALLVLSCILSGSFLRSNDGFVKFVSLCFLTVSVPLALTLISGKNRQNPKGLASLLDAPWAWFYLGVGRLPESVHGLLQAGKAVEQGSKKRRAALLGLLVAVPVVAVVMALLSSADAAFDGLLQQIPRMDLSEPVAAIVLGLFPAPVIYTLCVALRNESSGTCAPWQPKGIDPITVNTVLGAVCAVYLVYLCSQLAYFVGGLSGLLPKEYTLAQYARRGFFEMAILCMLNLGFIAAGNGLVGKKDGRAPLATRIMSLCIGLVTLFFVVTASAKMFLYIDSFGLTRLRVLTEVIMVFLAIATIFACIWLFVPKFAYMKAILLTALTLCSITAWADVDTVVAHYNVRAYQTGKAPFVDVYHLGDLSHGAIPALEILAADPDPETAAAAKSSLRQAAAKLEDTDLRSLTIAQLIARPILEKYQN